MLHKWLMMVGLISLPLKAAEPDISMAKDPIEHYETYVQSLTGSYAEGKANRFNHSIGYIPQPSTARKGSCNVVFLHQKIMGTTFQHQMLAPKECLVQSSSTACGETFVVFREARGGKVMFPCQTLLSSALKTGKPYDLFSIDAIGMEYYDVEAHQPIDVDPTPHPILAEGAAIHLLGWDQKLNSGGVVCQFLEGDQTDLTFTLNCPLEGHEPIRGAAIIDPKMGHMLIGILLESITMPDVTKKYFKASYLPKVD